MSIADKTDVAREAAANRCECFIRTRRGNTCCVRENGIFQLRIAACPRAEFDTRAKFGIDRVNGMRQQTWNERAPAWTFDKLRGTHEQAENHAEQGRIRQRPAGNMNEKFRTDGA